MKCRIASDENKIRIWTKTKILREKALALAICNFPNKQREIKKITYSAFYWYRNDLSLSLCYEFRYKNNIKIKLILKCKEFKFYKHFALE